MKTSIKHTHFGLSVAAVLLAMILVGPTVINLAYASPTFGGRATVVSINSLLGAVTLMDTGPLPPDGGELDATGVTIQTPVANADGLLAVTMGFDVAESQAAIGALVLLPGDPNEITAFFAMATSQASCSGVNGSSDITSLTMAGQPIQVTGQPNQVVDIPGVLTLTINEQIATDNSITVNALHLQTVLGTDVIISSASSSIDCSTTLGLPTLSLGLIQSAFALGGVPSTPGCIDFMTGGGWVKATPTSHQATFGFVAGFKNGGTNPRGELEFHDHDFGINAHALDVLYYNCGEFANSRVFGGHARVNGEEGWCYQVFAQDNGEPGKDTDFFSIFLWAPPTTCPTDTHPPQPATYANGNTLGGGNIQLHLSK